MPRIAEPRLREVKIYRLEGRERTQVDAVWGFNLRDGIERWYDYAHQEQGYHAPHFTANTVTLLTAEDEEETYVATD